MPRSSQKCVNRKCGETEICARGLCESCYRAASRLVKQKRTTWADLEKKKLAKPPGRGNPGSKMHQAIVGSK
jgi:hypothetical protein